MKIFSIASILSINLCNIILININLSNHYDTILSLYCDFYTQQLISFHVLEVNYFQNKQFFPQKLIPDIFPTW